MKVFVRTTHTLRVYVVGSRAQGLQFRVWGFESRVEGLGSGVEGLGSGGEGLGSGVEGLGSGVEGLGSGVQSTCSVHGRISHQGFKLGYTYSTGVGLYRGGPEAS